MAELDVPVVQLPRPARRAALLRPGLQYRHRGVRARRARHGHDQHDAHRFRRCRRRPRARRSSCRAEGDRESAPSDRRRPGRASAPPYAAAFSGRSRRGDRISFACRRSGRRIASCRCARSSSWATRASGISAADPATPASASSAVVDSSRWPSRSTTPIPSTRDASWPYAPERQWSRPRTYLTATAARNGLR
jgi:hypothetical protein